MIQIHVTLYGPMRVVAGQSNLDVSFDSSSATLAQVIEALIAARPRIQPYLLNEAGELQPILRILLNNQRLDPAMILTTQLHMDDHLVFLTPVAGGGFVL